MLNQNIISFLESADEASSGLSGISGFLSAHSPKASISDGISAHDMGSLHIYTVIYTVLPSTQCLIRERASLFRLDNAKPRSACTGSI